MAHHAQLGSSRALTSAMNAHLAKIARPARGLLFVRPVTTEETLPNGKVVLLAETREKWTGQQVEVVAIGAPEQCGEEDCERAHDALHCHPFSVNPGAWIIVRPRSTAELDPWSDLRVVRQADVLGVFTD